MRIAIDCRMKYGVGTILKNVVPRIAATVDHVVLIGDPNDMSRWDFTTHNVSLVEFKHPVYSWEEQVFFPRHAVAGVDIYHCPHFNIPLRDVGKAKLVVTINDLAHLSGILPISKLQRIYAKFFLHESVRRSVELITLSNFSRSEIEKEIPASHPKINVIGCAVDRVIFSPYAEKHAPPLPFLSDKIAFILTSGSLRPHKNLNSLLDAFVILKEKYGIPHKLVIAGQSKGFRLNSGVLKLPKDVDRDVIYTGFVTETQLAYLYSRCEAFVFPSLYEGFGLPPLEAMACGAPVITSDRASLPEVLGGAGILVDPLDFLEMARSIYSVVTDHSLAADLKRRSLERANFFSWDDVAKKYLEVYKQALKRAKGTNT